jgi:hypothetical protein
MLNEVKAVTAAELAEARDRACPRASETNNGVMMMKGNRCL